MSPLPAARDRAAQYREYAAAAERAAEQAQFPDVKKGFFEVADRWRRLAAELDGWIEAYSKTGTSV